MEQLDVNNFINQQIKEEVTSIINKNIETYTREFKEELEKTLHDKISSVTYKIINKLDYCIEDTTITFKIKKPLDRI